MKKDENDWEIEIQDNELFKDEPIHSVRVKINGENYYLPEYLAGLAHAILLLVDAVNDKGLK